DLVLDTERVVESALRDAAVQRHLAAFEPALEREAGERLRTLVTAAGRVAVAGALTAAHALLRVLRALWRFEIREIHRVLLFRDRNQVADIVEDVAPLDRSRHGDRVTDAAQAEAAQHFTLVPVEANRAL